MPQVVAPLPSIEQLKSKIKGIKGSEYYHFLKNDRHNFKNPIEETYNK